MGHYGSGKTSIAASFALEIKSLGREVTVADLDIVNPYYRTKDWAKEFEENGVGLVALPYANTNLDLPSLPSEIYGLLQRRDLNVVLDIGGDDRGAYALGRFRGMILEENDFDNYFVVNFLRPLTRTPDEALESMYEIAAASGIPFTGIVNNTNLGPETDARIILDGLARCRELSERSGLSIVFTTVEKPELLSDFKDADFGAEGLKQIKVKRII